MADFVINSLLYSVLVLGVPVGVILLIVRRVRRQRRDRVDLLERLDRIEATVRRSGTGLG